MSNHRVLLRWANSAALFTVGLLVGRERLQAACLPTHLRCEHRSNPLGIDATLPRLNWVLTSDERGQGQIAYRILVAR